MPTEKYKNKYRIQSHRLPGWDYSGAGIYFITIVTQHRICNLGKIKNAEMELSDFGKIAKQQWHQSFEIRKELFLNEFIIMPNHIHAMVVLQPPEIIGSDGNSDGIVETHGRASLRANSLANQFVFQRKPKSISSFVAGYKSAVTTKIDDYIDFNGLNIAKYNRKNKFWQPNYHDHIVRNENEYCRIKNYIKSNPTKWNDDKFYQ